MNQISLIKHDESRDSRLTIINSRGEIQNGRDQGVAGWDHVMVGDQLTLTIIFTDEMGEAQSHLFVISERRSDYIYVIYNDFDEYDEDSGELIEKPELPPFDGVEFEAGTLLWPLTEKECGEFVALLDKADTRFKKKGEE
jgi:hypothetical protein